MYAAARPLMWRAVAADPEPPGSPAFAAVVGGGGGEKCVAKGVLTSAASAASAAPAASAAAAAVSAASAAVLLLLLCGVWIRLQCLYNAFPPSFPYRFPIFVAALEYAAETKLFASMLPYVKYISDWMQDWNLTPSSKRQVYLILANELKKLGKSEEAYSYLKRHVQFFQGEREEVLSNGATVSAAAELVEDSIRLPDVLVFDNLVELHAVQYLAHTSHAELLQLLRLFVNKGPVELEAFKQQHPQVFEEHGLNYEQCLGKIRLLAIASLVGKGKKEVSLKTIADVLRVDEAAAEEAAVQAIGQGTIDAKIDQMAKVVHVRSAMQREFHRPQWEELLERLECWQDGVRALLGCMKNVKQQMSAAAASAATSAASALPPASTAGAAVPAASPAAEALL